MGSGHRGVGVTRRGPQSTWSTSGHLSRFRSRTTPRPGWTENHLSYQSPLPFLYPFDSVSLTSRVRSGRAGVQGAPTKVGTVSEQVGFGHGRGSQKWVSDTPTSPRVGSVPDRRSVGSTGRRRLPTGTTERTTSSSSSFSFTGETKCPDTKVTIYAFMPNRLTAQAGPGRGSLSARRSGTGSRTLVSLRTGTTLRSLPA